MSIPLTQHNPSHFKTQPLRVQATESSLHYEAQGLPINFAQMLALRCPISIDDPANFDVRLANLGVSVRLTLHWAGQAFWVLVRQQRPDRGDQVLKMISGYVPAHELLLPLHTALQEVAEECLLEQSNAWFRGRYQDTWLPTPYAPALHYLEQPHFELSSRSCSVRPIHNSFGPLLERPRAYIHTPTASLQLVYDLHLTVPDNAAPQLSLYHVDECLNSEGNLVAQLHPQQPDLYLIPLHHGQPSDSLYQLQQGQLHPVHTQNVWLSEGFAEQTGWLVTQERITWQHWRAQLQQNQ